MLESTCLVTSPQLVQARMVETCPKKVNKKRYFLYIKQGLITHSLNVKKNYFTFPLNERRVQSLELVWTALYFSPKAGEEKKSFWLFYGEKKILLPLSPKGGGG